MSSSQIEFRLGQMPAGSQPVETSEDAADRLQPKLGERRRRVLELFNSHPHGLTADEVGAHFGTANANTYAPRVTELEGMGLLVKCDGKDGRPKLKRSTRSGGDAFVSRITAAGRRVFEG